MSSTLSIAPRGLGEGRDTQLSLSSPDSVISPSATSMSVGRIAGPSTARILVGFDLTGERYGISGIPEGATILSASLTMLCSTAAASSAAGTVYQLEPSVAVDPDVQTWNTQETGVPWLSAGGDYDRNESVAFALPIVTGLFEIDGLETLVQAALDENGGDLALLLRLNSESGSANFAAFRRCNHTFGSPDPRPTLTVEYEPRIASTTTVSAAPSDSRAIAALAGDPLWRADLLGSSAIVSDDTPVDP
jgi:hypothetical protein